jgi:hypothetical protein
MIFDVDELTAVHLGVAARSHIRELRRAGVEPPAALVRLATRLDPAAVRAEERNRIERNRAQARERMRRLRARRRGQAALPAPSRLAGRSIAAARSPCAPPGSGLGFVSYRSPRLLSGGRH